MSNSIDSGVSIIHEQKRASVYILPERFQCVPRRWEEEEAAV